MAESGAKKADERTLHDKLDEVIESLKILIKEKQQEHQEVLKKLERLG